MRLEVTDQVTAVPEAELVGRVLGEKEWGLLMSILSIGEQTCEALRGAKEPSDLMEGCLSSQALDSRIRAFSHAIGIPQEVATPDDGPF